MKRTVAVVRPRGPDARLAHPTADAFTACFRRLGWNVEQVSSPIQAQPDLVAGYGWRHIMAEAWSKWPDRLLHVDGAFWNRNTHVKLALGDRWSALVDHDYDDQRLQACRVAVSASRPAGTRVLLCGMSAKASTSFGLEPEQWERAAADRLRAAGAKVLYRPKPRWCGARPISGCAFEDWSRVTVAQSFAKVDAVATHHSNAAIEAVAAGLPIYTETGIARALSVARLEDLPGAAAHDRETRVRFVRQVAWHQWTLAEISSGAWLKSPAPLADSPIFANG
jgi:hypothetical protein